LHGNAFDIPTAGMSPQEIDALIKAGVKAGFRGFGGYDGSVHFDVGPQRTWGPSYGSDTTPQYLKAALSGAEFSPMNYATPTISTKGGQAVNPDEIAKDATAQSTGGGLLGMLGGQSDQPRPTMKERFRDPNFWNEIALGFHSMASFPNQAAINMLSSRIERGEARKQEQDQINKTVAFFDKLGDPRLSELARFAPSAALSLYGQMQKPVSEGEAIKQYRLAVDQGFKGTFFEYKKQLAEAGRPVTGAQEKAWEKGLGEWGVEQYAKAQEEAANADKMLAQAAELEQLMLDPNFMSGGLAEQKMAAKKIIEALGGDPAKVESMEAFQAVSSQLVLDSMGGSLGAGFSEGDRKFVERMQPSLTTSKAGNQLIIQMTRKIAQRKKEIARFADEYIAKNGKIDAKFKSALREWSNQNPLFAGGNAAGYLD
jgi:hypothetical protein